MSVISISTKQLLEMLTPPGLKLSEAEKKLLFFRDLAAQYSSRAKYGRTPNANNISRAAQTFGGLGSGGADPMTMLLLTKALGDKDEAPAEEPTKLTDVLVALKDSIDGINNRLDTIGVNESK